MALPLRVLIVEDDANDAELLVHALRRAGYAPEITLVDTVAGLRGCLRHPWDVIFSDYSMPQFSGLDALAEVQAAGLDLPFIIVSGTIGEETAVEAMRRGASDYLLKDRLGRLGPSVAHAIEQGRLRRENRRAQLALAESEQRFRQLADNIPEVFWISDVSTNRMLYVSPAFERIWGLPCSEVLERPALWLERVHPDDRPAIERAASGREAGGYEVDYRILQSDGSVRWIHDKAFPVRGNEGVIYRWVGVAEDVTERRRLEERILRAQRMEVIGSLTSGITHDLNNILGSMLMAAGLVKGRSTEARDREMLTAVESGAQRGARMIAQLLSFSRGVEGTRSRVNLPVVIDELGGLVRATFSRSIDLKVDVAKNLMEIEADATQLHQVLMNLCVNARDAMPKGGLLTVSVENRLVAREEARKHLEARPGWHVTVSVSDTGEGIPPAIIDRIFDPFFTTKPLGKGTGLGLASVLGIMKSHGGFVSVESEAGRGSTFRVHFPVTTGGGSAGTVVSALPFARGREELILVVDDEPDLLLASSDALRAHGYRVVTATSGEDALRVFLEHADSVRVVLTNLHMPGMGGLALVRSLRVLENPHIGYVVASGGQDPGLHEELRRLGVGEFLSKPYAPRSLLQAVTRILEATPPPPSRPVAG